MLNMIVDVIVKKVMEIVSNLEQEDIDDNAAIFNDPTGSDSISGNGLRVLLIRT